MLPSLLPSHFACWAMNSVSFLVWTPFSGSLLLQYCFSKPKPYYGHAHSFRHLIVTIVFLKLFFTFGLPLTKIPEPTNTKFVTYSSWFAPSVFVIATYIAFSSASVLANNFVFLWFVCVPAIWSNSIDIAQTVAGCIAWCVPQDKVLLS